MTVALQPLQNSTFVQAALNGTSVALPVQPTITGSVLVVFVWCNQTTATTSVSAVADTASNTWVQRGSTATSGSGAGHLSSQVFTAENATSITSFTVHTTAAAAEVVVEFFEFAGVGTSATDVTNQGTGVGVLSIAPTLNAPSQIGDLVLYGAGVGATSSTLGIAHTPDDKLALSNAAAPNATSTSGVASSIVGVLGSPAVATSTQFTSGASANYAWSAIALKASAGQIGPLYTVANGQTIQAEDVNQVVNLLSGNTNGQLYVAGPIQAAFSGAAGQGRYCGGVVNGPPTTGTFMAGDWVSDSGFSCMWICTVPGSPGTWKKIGNGGFLARAGITSAQNFTNVSSFGVHFAATATFDPRSMWNAANNRFVAPYTGTWLIGGWLSCSTSNGAGAGFELSLNKNGAEVSRGTSAPIPSSGAFGGVVVDIVSLTAGDLLTMSVGFFNGVTVTGNTSAGAMYICAMDA